MFVFRLLLKNAFRHKLRTGLTVLGLVVAICAFGLLRTIVDAWYAGVEGSSSTRLIVRSNISLTFPLPLNYAQRLRAVEGVRQISWSNWFGGVYITERNFFPQFAVDAATYLPLYPLRGTVYPGTWTFTLRGIWDGADAKTDESQLLMHWAYINESVRQRSPGRGNAVGVYIVGIDEPANAAAVGQRIDRQFANSLAETMTETEAAFQLSFVSMSEAILVAVQAVSLIIVVIIMAVMANTMTMTARERLAEYATLKALGFPPGFVVRLLLGESLLIAAIGGVAGLLLTWPLAAAFRSAAGTLFPIFQVSTLTMALQLVAALVVGLVAAAWPAWRMGRIDIVNGLRHVG